MVHASNQVERSQTRRFVTRLTGSWASTKRNGVPSADWILKPIEGDVGDERSTSGSKESNTTYSPAKILSCVRRGTTAVGSCASEAVALAAYIGVADEAAGWRAADVDCCDSATCGAAELLLNKGSERAGNDPDNGWETGATATAEATASATTWRTASIVTGSWAWAGGVASESAPRRRARSWRRVPAADNPRVSHAARSTARLEDGANSTAWVTGLLLLRVFIVREGKSEKQRDGSTPGGNVWSSVAETCWAICARLDRGSVYTAARICTGGKTMRGTRPACHASCVCVAA